MLRSFVAISGFVFLLAPGLRAEPDFSTEKEQVCNLQFEPPQKAGLLKLESDLALYRLALALNRRTYHIQLMLLCNRNVNFTSRVGELEAMYRKKGDRIRNYREFSIVHEIPAARLERLRVTHGKKLLSREIYFATRDYEYHIRLFPENLTSLRLSERLLYSEPANETLRKTLASLSFQSPPQTTIKESEFRLRLYLAVAAACGLALFLVIRLIRKILA